MSATTPAIPPGFHTVTPHLVVAGAAAALDFYAKAFGAVETARMEVPDGSGKLMHAAMRIGDSMVFVIDADERWKSRDPMDLGGSPVSMHLYVEDVDAFFDRAVEAGCTVGMALEDMFWGDRFGMVVDPYGHQWTLATHKRDVAAEEMAEAMRAMGAA